MTRNAVLLLCVCGAYTLLMLAAALAPDWLATPLFGVAYFPIGMPIALGMFVTIVIVMFIYAFFGRRT